MWGTNNLPKLEGIDDEGYYRRMFILPFEKKFSKDEVNNFDKDKILTPEALDYLANISLREYLKIMNNKNLSYLKESNNIILEYRKSNNSAKEFLQDELIIDEIFEFDNKVLKTAMYDKYIKWCLEHNFFTKKRAEFYEQVLSNPEYQECKTEGGYDFFRNLNKKSKNEIKPLKF